jgi:hypothetical protein
MRGSILTLVLLAGCTFSVHGTNAPSSPGSDTQSPLPQAPTTPPPDLALSTEPPPPDRLPPPVRQPPVATPPPDMALQPVGGPCNSDGDCQNGLSCFDTLGNGHFATVFDNGYCTRNCILAPPCPSGSVCGGLGLPVCVASCPPSSCRSGYTCCSSNNACVPSSACGDQ